MSRRCRLASLAGCSEKRTSNSSETTNFLHAKSQSWRPATAMSSRFAKPHGNNSDEGGRNVDRGIAYGLANRTRGWKTVVSELAGKANTRQREWIYRSRNRFFYSRVSILHTGCASKSSLTVRRAKMHFVER